MEGQPIVCKAAVLWAPDEPLKIEQVTVAPPREGEVRVRVAFTSVCRTDLLTWSGNDPFAGYPVILGHEGAGVVESVGAGVTSVAPGDHVVPLYIPQCRECRVCRRPGSNACLAVRDTQAKGMMPDGTSRFSIDGKPILCFLSCSTFSEYTVMPEISVAKVRPDAPLDRACLLGCGVSTGYGAALNTARIQKGDTVAIFGLGAVGLAVALGCREAGASRIIGVDINEAKFALAADFGVTECVNPKEHSRPIQQVLAELTDGGLDHTFECIGNVQTMRDALEASHLCWGQFIMLGVSGIGQDLPVHPFQMFFGRTIRSSIFGGWKSRDNVPKLVDLYSEGKLPVDKFISHRLNGVESLNEAISLLRSGQALRTVVSMKPADKSE